MQQVGIYEQLITQLIESRIDRERFYVGERELNSSEASTWLSRFLSHILEYAIESVPSSDDRLQHQIALSNQLLLWLKTQIQDMNIFCPICFLENLFLVKNSDPLMLKLMLYIKTIV